MRYRAVSVFKVFLLGLILLGCSCLAWANGADNSIFAIAVSGNDIYVGGSFTHIGTVSANRIAKYSTVTRTWTALGSGVDQTVRAIAINNGTV